MLTILREEFGALPSESAYFLHYKWVDRCSVAVELEVVLRPDGGHEPGSGRLGDPPENWKIFDSLNPPAYHVDIHNIESYRNGYYRYPDLLYFRPTGIVFLLCQDSFIVITVVWHSLRLASERTSSRLMDFLSRSTNSSKSPSIAHNSTISF